MKSRVIQLAAKLYPAGMQRDDFVEHVASDAHYAASLEINEGSLVRGAFKRAALYAWRNPRPRLAIILSAVAIIVGPAIFFNTFLDSSMRWAFAMWFAALGSSIFAYSRMRELARGFWMGLALSTVLLANEWFFSRSRVSTCEDCNGYMSHGQYFFGGQVIFVYWEPWVQLVLLFAALALLAIQVDAVIKRATWPVLTIGLIYFAAQGCALLLEMLLSGYWQGSQAQEVAFDLYASWPIREIETVVFASLAVAFLIVGVGARPFSLGKRKAPQPQR